mmetsp:Transcript_17368/g.36126  ORF Transcript_17368/g.36126 Transcript_17368/m.36126 type:complete len:313 (-) Transcript_17368:673-1611(-)
MTSARIPSYNNSPKSACARSLLCRKMSMGGVMPSRIICRMANSFPSSLPTNLSSWRMAFEATAAPPSAVEPVEMSTGERRMDSERWRTEGPRVAEKRARVAVGGMAVRMESICWRKVRDRDVPDAVGLDWDWLLLMSLVPSPSSSSVSSSLSPSPLDSSVLSFSFLLFSSSRFPLLPLSFSFPFPFAFLPPSLASNNRSASSKTINLTPRNLIPLSMHSTNLNGVETNASNPFFPPSLFEDANPALDLERRTEWSFPGMFAERRRTSRWSCEASSREGARRTVRTWPRRSGCGRRARSSDGDGGWGGGVFVP